MTELKHSIRVASQRTGLSSHAIRIWEKRYSAVTPTRTTTNRRLYTDAEIERLTLLHQATQSGHNISNVARLSTDQLRTLSAQNRSQSVPAAALGGASGHPAQSIEQCLNAIRQLDSQGLEQLLDRGAVLHGQHGLLHKVIAPLTHEIGELWRVGAITAAHEHMATWVIRLFLGRISKPFALNGVAPLLIVATPAGQLHEMGAVMVAAAANDSGWKVNYLGGSLPAPEIAGVAIQSAARAVALSIVYPEDDPNLTTELQNLRRYLPPAVTIIAGGRAAPAYREALASIGAQTCRDLQELYGHLDRLRQPRT
jgi:DNA-binding transcriptional MerR regulator/methylmalonyl-CoA mutase cobalamin-binding subunit